MRRLTAEEKEQQYIKHLEYNKKYQKEHYGKTQLLRSKLRYYKIKYQVDTKKYVSLYGLTDLTINQIKKDIIDNRLIINN